MAKSLPVSPLAPKDGFPDLPEIAGVTFSSLAAGVRYAGRADLMLALCAPGTVVAGTFTRSRTRSAPVLDCQAKLGGPSEAGAATLVNAGNANAFTGHKGIEAVEAITAKVAERAGVPGSRVFTSSTGVIGEALPHDRITSAIDTLVATTSPDGIASAAKAITTTDTFPKGSGVTIDIDGREVSISGIAKGSGMIAPDMATMLVYIFTDAQIEQAYLQTMVSGLCEKTFNAITVDSDTSTSDTLLVAATGASGVEVTNKSNFQKALLGVMQDLAFQVVRDGEGASKFISIAVTGAASDNDAKLCAMAIANSPLVKTAVAGEDPNWGRVVMAVGKSGAEADRDRLSIWFGDTKVATDGLMDPHYVEADAAEHMKGDEVLIRVDLGLGAGRFTAYTCDLTAGYIAINADYRS